MKTILSFLKPYKPHIIVAYSLMLFELTIELLLPFFLGKMINDGVLHKDVQTIVMWGSIMITLALFSFGAGIANSFYASHTSWGFATDIRGKMFQHIQRFSFANLNKYPTSGLVTRFTNDVRQIQHTIFMALRIMTRAPLLVIGGVIMAFIVNAKLALIFLITVPLLTSFVLWVLKKGTAMFNQVQRYVDRVNRTMQENLAGIRLIKAFLRSNHEEKRFMKANKQLADMTQSTFRFIEASMPILLFVMNLSLVFIIWFGHTQSLAGTTSVGEVVAIVNYALRVSMAISMFTFIILAYSRAKASAERIQQIFAVDVYERDEEDVKNSPTISDGTISFHHVSFTYPSAKQPVLHDVSFTIERGEKLAIIGATGSGKTSLFQLIPRLYDVSSGDIFIDQEPLTSYSLDHLRKNIGYVPQSSLLFTGTITENIAWGKTKATIDEVIQATRNAQIHETIMNLPDQYETKVGQKGVNLSGGQKQRISIARALIRQPKILMLDDSTSALDVATESRLLQAIETYDCTMLIITQKISTAIRADKILLLDDGKVLALDSHEELLQSSNLYQQIVASQFGKENLHAH
ncbi:MAG TPA: ABC transporter ATP-binding protein [Bacillota bacterium]